MIDRDLKDDVDLEYEAGCKCWDKVTAAPFIMVKRLMCGLPECELVRKLSGSTKEDQSKE